MRSTAPPAPEAPLATPKAAEPRPWHVLSAEAAAQKLQTDTENGLTEEEASQRLAQLGPNELIDRGGKGAARMLADQFASTMIALLVAAGAASAVFGETQDALAILAIVILNASLGFFQEYRAERALAALRLLAVPQVRIRRSGKTAEISARELVAGDVVLIESGSVVPADGRLTQAAALLAQEAALTGESAPVEKETAPLAHSALALGDRVNMVFSGTSIARGRGRFIVTETGMRTELGRIASLLEAAGRQPTPLQKRLDQLGRRLALAVTAIAAVIFVEGLLRGESARVMLMTAVSLAVAAVPEGLPAVVTIALAMGARRMYRRNALVRTLPAVEALGSVDVICTDKTGTLTQGRMSVTILDCAGRRAELATDDRELVAERPALEVLLWSCVLCNDAALEGLPKGGWKAVGDPVEAALLAAAARHGLEKLNVDKLLPRVSELPFDSERKMMTTVHRFGDGGDPFHSWRPQKPFLAVTKGAVENLLRRVEHVWDGAAIGPLDSRGRQDILEAQTELASKGMRVLGIAARSWSDIPPKEELERGLVYVGLIGLIDPPKPEAAEAVRTCLRAGIRPVMVTGDHPLTAAAIASQVAIPASPTAILSGEEFENLPPSELAAAAERISVFARVSPAHKIAIVEALQARGHSVAMTGDGVNDAPALRRADIGVAMGRGGTDTAKEAADIVLLDDNFATIVSAVEEGRVVYDNIRKFLRYLLTTNSAEILVMLAAPLFGMPLPLLPLQILWINLVTDGPPALAFALEPAEPGVMDRPPRPRSEGLLTQDLGWHALWVSGLMTAVSLGAGWTYWREGLPEWRTMIFTTLAFAQLANVAAARSESEPLWRVGLFSNPWLLAATAGAAGAQILAVEWDWLREVLGTSALGGRDLALAAGFAVAVYAAVEAEKLIIRRRARA